MRVRRDILFLAALAAVLSGCDLDEIGSFGNAHAYEKDFHHSYPLKSGGRLSLESFNGPVEIGGWDQDKVEIDAVQYASSARLRVLDYVRRRVANPKVVVSRKRSWLPQRPGWPVA
jgi:hypothetical protein